MGKEIDPVLLKYLKQKTCEICHGTVEVKIVDRRVVVTSPDCKNHRKNCLRSMVEEKLAL